MQGAERARLRPRGSAIRRWFLCSFLAPAVGAQQSEPVFLELSTPRSTYFVHERIALRLRLGFEQGFLQDGMVQIFPQSLDVPAQLVAPWLDDLPGALALGEPSDPSVAPAASPLEPQPAVRARFALNDGVA